MKWTPDLNGFKAYLQLERSLSENSIEAYLRDVDKLVQFFETISLEISPTKVTDNHLTDFINWIGEIGLGARSQARIISGLKAFYNYLIMEDRITIDPTELISMPTLGRKLPEVLNIEEINAMIAVVDLSKAEGERNRAIIETLYSCGLRVSELVNLQLSHVLFEEGFLRVTGKGNKERLVPMGKVAIKYILYYLEATRNHTKIKKGDHDILFLNRRGGRLTRVMIFTIVKNLALLADIDKTVSPHTFRHSFATHLIDGGADLRAVQEMLGHESITTTEIYTHLDVGYLKDTITQFHPRA
jgi:integrase/recombinase XerD